MKDEYDEYIDKDESNSTFSWKWEVASNIRTLNQKTENN